MLKTNLLHPDIIATLARSGHFSQVLIADGNYPVEPGGRRAERLERNAFYDAVCSQNTTLVIATGDTRRFANLILTVGVLRLKATIETIARSTVVQRSGS